MYVLLSLDEHVSIHYRMGNISFMMFLFICVYCFFIIRLIQPMLALHMQLSLRSVAVFVSCSKTKPIIAK